MMPAGAARFVIPIVLATARVSAEPAALVFELRNQLVCRGPAVWQFAPSGFKLLLTLAVSQGRPLGMRDLVDAIWCDDPDGGPISAEKLVAVNLCRLRPRLPALGVAIERHGFTYGLVDRLSVARAA